MIKVVERFCQCLAIVSSCFEPMDGRCADIHLICTIRARAESYRINLDLRSDVGTNLAQLMCSCNDIFEAFLRMEEDVLAYSGQLRATVVSMRLEDA